MPKLIRWEVAPAPTGPYRSFDVRGWPSAFYVSTGDPAVNLTANEAYTPQIAKIGRDGLEITVHVAFWRSGGQPGSRTFDWRRLNRRCKTLGEAKTIAERFIGENLERIYPADLRRKD